jgi:hypothetical protein
MSIIKRKHIKNGNDNVIFWNDKDKFEIVVVS